jgi:cytoskeletal protein CcmA (bactofilin family)
MRTDRRWWTAAAAAGFVLLVLGTTAAPATAGTGPRDREDRNRRVAVGDIRVAPGEVVDGPLIGIDGDTRIAGTVDGSAVVIRGDLVVVAGGEIDGDVLVVRGDARIDGRVDGDVVVLRGRAVVRADAVVDGDVRSTDGPSVARGARVTGEVDDIDLTGIASAIGAGVLVFWWFAVTISTAVLGAILLALVPRGFETAAAVGRDRKHWWVALLVGIGLVIALPVLSIAAVSSLVGLPFGLGLLGTLGLVHALGYVAGAFFLGRCILKSPRNRFGAFFVGWAILRVAALVPGFGVLVWIAAAVYGLGTLAVAGFRAGQSPRAPAPDAAPTHSASVASAP